MADACYLAWSLTGDTKWKRLTLRSAAWLLGTNDLKVVLYDHNTGGTNDGLTTDGVTRKPRSRIDLGRSRHAPGRSPMYKRHHLIHAPV